MGHWRRGAALEGNIESGDNTGAGQLAGDNTGAGQLAVDNTDTDEETVAACAPSETGD